MQPTTEMLLRNRLAQIKHDITWVTTRISSVEEELDGHQKTKIVLEAQQAEIMQELKDAGKNVDDPVQD